MPKKLSKAVVEKIVRMYAEGNQSGNAIADELGYSRGYVYRILRQNGHKSSVRMGPARKYNLTTRQEKRMVIMYGAGDSCETIAQAFNIPWSAVNKRLADLGVQLRPGGFRKGSEHHGWKGGRLERTDGYIVVLVSEDDPLYCMAQVKTNTARYALEHRLVMARHLGRPLESNETVHHIDGDKSNNSIENLQLRQGKHGKGSLFRCLDCGSYNVELAVLTEVN